MANRMERINSEIRRQLMVIIQQELDDPCIGLFSITRVDTTLDLSESRIYYSLLDDSKYERVQKVLEAMLKTIRVNLAKRIQLRILPQLKFFPDDSIKYSVDIYKKIEDVRQQDLAKHNRYARSSNNKKNRRKDSAK